MFSFYCGEPRWVYGGFVCPMLRIYGVLTVIPLAVIHPAVGHPDGMGICVICVICAVIVYMIWLVCACALAY